MLLDNKLYTKYIFCYINDKKPKALMENLNNILFDLKNGHNLKQCKQEKYRKYYCNRETASLQFALW